MIVALALASALSLPVKVDGEGYLRFVREGRIVYATSATLAIQGGVLGSRGLPLTPAVRVPAQATKLEVDLAGNISADVPDGRKPCGQIVLARFDTKLAEDNGFLVTMGRARIGNPGEGLFGVIRTTITGSGIQTQGPEYVGQPSIVVRKVTEIEGDVVTLGDIGTITAEPATKATLEELAFCSTPSIGIDMAVTASRIEAIAKRAGIEVRVEVEPPSIVRRKSQTIKQEDFVAVAIKAARASIGFEVPMTCLDQPQGDFRAPLGQFELRAEDVTTSGMQMTVIVGVFIEGRRVNSRNVMLKLDASAQIKAGAIVKIVMKSSGVTVEVPGKTRTGGMVGQSVTVVTDTGSVLTGIVLSANTVEVKI